MKNLKTNILLIYTGGTIGMVKDPKTGSLKAFDFSKIQERITELEQLDCNITTISFDKPIDSSDMNIERWVEIASIIEEHYDNFDGFVVLHGSDTMSYSASALSFMIENLTKPVVFTGSQLPIGDLRTDAKENLITAIQIACLKENNQAVIQEVCLYFEYKLYRGNRTTKINAEHFEVFESPNYPELVQSGLHLVVNNEALYKPNRRKRLKVHKAMESNILLVKIFPGIDESTIKYLFDYPEMKGLVLETYGAGNVTTEEWFINSLKNVIKRRV